MSSSEKAVPTFICVGSQKAGTDWVYEQFRNHDDYEMPPLKEIHFFNKAFGYQRVAKAQRKLGWMNRQFGKNPMRQKEINFLDKIANPHGVTYKDVEYYINLFAEFTEKCSADVCPGYIHLNDHRLKTMAEALPLTRFFAIVRDPIQRAWSQAQMHFRLRAGNHSSHPTATFSPAAFLLFLMDPNVQKLSLISGHLARHSATLGERFKIFFFDDLRDSPNDFRSRLADHVGADPTRFNLPAGFNRKANQPYKKPMPDDIKAIATVFFKTEYQALADLLGGHAVCWKEANDRRVDTLVTVLGEQPTG